MKKATFALVCFTLLFVVLTSQAAESPFVGLSPIKLTRLDTNEFPVNELSIPVTHGGGMFNPVFIPFKYSVAGVEADPWQRLTFPSLLSFKYSFVPNNYSTMQACFIFRADPQSAILDATDPEKLVDFAKKWSATHIITGSITASPNGFKGSQDIYDASGKIVFSQVYTESLPYFTLMGRMVEDWMVFCKQPCDAKLKIELERPMTRRPESLALFGKAFDQKWHTDGEWAIYRQILQADPTFGEVRWWLANQQGWINGFTSAIEAEIARAFLDHPVITAMSEYTVAALPDATLKPKADLAFKRSLALQPDHCKLIARAMSNRSFWERKSLAEREQLLDLAVRFPAMQPIADHLSWYFSNQNHFDRSMALDLSAINSGYLPGNGSFYRHWYRAGLGYWALGRPNAALSCFSSALEQTTNSSETTDTLYAIIGLYRDYLDAPSALELAKKYLGDINDPKLLTQGILAACEAGDNTQVDDWMNDVEQLPNFEQNLVRCAIQFSTGKQQQYTAIGRNPATIADHISLDFAQYAQGCANAPQRSGIIRTWLLSPRTPRSAILLKRILLPNKPGELLQYAEVMCRIAPEVPFWSELREDARKAGGTDPTGADLPAMLENIETTMKEEPVEMINGIPVHDMGKINQLFERVVPLQPEMALFLALEQNDPAVRSRALSAYNLYAARTVTISPAMKVHLRGFTAMVCSKLPPDQAAVWRATYNKTLQ